MIKPINGHILIEPLTQEGFIASQKETYEEIGVVIGLPALLTDIEVEELPELGDKVFFDSWLAARYPKGDSDEFFWLVRLEDIRAIQKNG